MKNSYPPLVKTNHEPEYKASPPLKISSVGTEIKKNSSVMPDGSALLTNTGSNSSLKIQGIDYIVHAVPKMRSSCISDEEFIEIAVKAAQNSIILADREGIEKLAICFIAGKIYRGSCPPEKLAKAIIMGALDQIEENRENLKKIIFVAFKKDDPDPSKEIYEPYLVDAFDKVERASTDYFVKCRRFAEIVSGDICDKGIHGAEAIVNSENAQMGWGGGISGAIQTALGSKASYVDQQRKDLMKKFNELKNQEEDDNTAEISFKVRYGGGYGINNKLCYIFFVEGEQNKSFIIDPEHSVFKGLSNLWRTSNSGTYPPVKITIKKSDKDKGLFEKKDFIKIEEIKNDDKGKDNKTPEEWQEELKKVDNDLKQVFNEDKVNEFKSEGKFGRVEEVKTLLNSVKDNSQFLNLIKTNQNSNSLKEFVSKNPASEVIKVIKRFEFDNLSQLDKEKKTKKIREYYKLGENDNLTDERISEYCYRVAIGQIKEDEQDQNTIDPKNNILKYLGISALVLIPLGLFLAFFIRKRKK